MAEMTTAQRHNVPLENRNDPYAELSQFIMSKLEETKYPTAKQLSEWFSEHAEYFHRKNVRFGYTTFVPNKVKRLT